MTDGELLDKARSGDTDAFEILVKRYESQVAATVNGMLGMVPEADDVGQEVFIRFYKALHQFRHESSIGTYLTRIAINLSLNELKKRKRRRMLFGYTENESAAPLMDPEVEATANENYDLVHRALQRLEPKFRTVLVLRLIDGYSTEETAQILGVPQGTVLSRLSRAQKKVQKILSPIEEEL